MSQLLNLSPGTRADLLIVTPKILGALLAAITDFSTWKLGERIHGCGTSTSWASVSLSDGASMMLIPSLCFLSSIHGNGSVQLGPSLIAWRRH